MGRGFVASLCALAVSASVCAAAGPPPPDRDAGQRVAAARVQDAGCHGASAARVARAGPLDEPLDAVRDLLRDRADLTPQQVTAMLSDLRTRLRDRFGIDDERDLAARTRQDTLTVPVRFHVVHDGAAGRVSRALVERQVATLNAAYGGKVGGSSTGVVFRLQDVTYTDNARWHSDPERHESAMKSRLRRGDAETLNLYTAAVGADVLGFSTFPQWLEGDPELDGVVVDFRTLPGGAYGKFDRGYTAVHEIGHWLGLFHTFENGCGAPGDGVDDTPAEREPAHGCPTGRDTCPSPGADPIHNFMNYSDDACMREFTPGQGTRIRSSWAAYRAGKTAARGGEPSLAGLPEWVRKAVVGAPPATDRRVLSAGVGTLR